MRSSMLCTASAGVRFAAALCLAAALCAAPAAHAEKGLKKKKNAPVLPFKPQAAATPAAATAAPQAPAATNVSGTAQNPFGGNFSKDPTYVKSDALTVQNNQRTFQYTGNVEVKHGDMILTCDILDGTYNEKNEIQQLVAHSRVVVVKGPGGGIRATGERGVYERAADTVTLTENPELQQSGSVLTGDTIVIHLKENRSEAQGAVRVKMVSKDSDGDKKEDKKKKKKF